MDPQTITIYQRGDLLRVVRGEHIPHANSAHCLVTVFPDASTARAAAGSGRLSDARRVLNAVNRIEPLQPVICHMADPASDGKPARTPGPWQLGATQITVALGGYDVWVVPISGHGTAIGCVYAGSVGKPRSVETELANAAFIVTACNAHDDLVVALREIAICGSSINDDGECIELRADRCRRVARAALAKVQS